jgi:5-formyltetrahydrofolate cyclo-ligase
MSETDETSPTTRPDKQQLRNLLRQRRRALSPAQQRDAADGVIQQITAIRHWHEAQCIGLYLAADGEVDTGPLAKLGRAASKELFLPVIRADNSLAFAVWEQGATLRPNRFGIPEPGSERREATHLDLLIVPLVGWDRSGGRLGMGGGFYDRSLCGQVRPVLVGLAHDCQEVSLLPRDSWDVPVDFIATDTALYDCQGVNKAART